MQNNLISRAFASLKQQPLVSALSLIGSALAIFLIMVVVMTVNLPYSDLRPETNKDRWLAYSYTTISNNNWGDGFNTSNGTTSFKTIKETIYSLTTPEEVTAFGNGFTTTPIAAAGGTPVPVLRKDVDDRFFKVFDFDWKSGEPFTREQFDSGVPVVVISASVAKKLFGNTDVTGRQVELDHMPYRICGVVADVPSVSHFTYGDVWVPFSATTTIDDVWNDGYMGSLSALILARDKADFPAIREEYGKMLAKYNAQIGEAGWEIKRMGRPYDIEEELSAPWANQEPDVKALRKRHLITYAILLLVPAVNLSSMTNSRLSRRAKEIGVRRAFGATRFEIMSDLFMENLVITVAAGLVGWLLSMIFALLFKEPFFSATWGADDITGVSVGSLMQWSTFGWALFFCFLLNLLSAGIPALQASRTNIVNALSGKK